VVPFVQFVQFVQTPQAFTHVYLEQAPHGVGTPPRAVLLVHLPQTTAVAWCFVILLFFTVGTTTTNRSLSWNVTERPSLRVVACKRDGAHPRVADAVLRCGVLL